MKQQIGVSLDMVLTGQRLNHMIRKRGYTVSKIQEELKLSCPQSIYRWLSGQTMPSIDNLYKLSVILEVHMEDLVMPRQDEVWYLYKPENCHGLRRLKKYRRVYRGICQRALRNQERWGK